MIGRAIALATRLLVGGYPRWIGCLPAATPRIYFANHSSHLDTIVLWAALPAALRARTHPVAARDYWDANPVRRLVARRGLNAVLIDRNRTGVHKQDPLAEARTRLAAGDSLILFPEGTRGTGPLPSEFRSGIHHLATAFPDAELVPVYLTNPFRAYPKGAILPAPITCTASFGAPMALVDGESRADFLERARAAVCDLAPQQAPVSGEARVHGVVS